MPCNYTAGGLCQIWSNVHWTANSVVQCNALQLHWRRPVSNVHWTAKNCRTLYNSIIYKYCKVVWNTVAYCNSATRCNALHIHCRRPVWNLHCTVRYCKTLPNTAKYCGIPEEYCNTLQCLANTLQEAFVKCALNCKILQNITNYCKIMWNSVKCSNTL